MPDSMTQVLSSGPPGTKVNIAVLGDGFADGAGGGGASALGTEPVGVTESRVTADGR